MTIINNQDLIYLANTTFFIEDYNNEYIYISEMPDYLGKGKNSFLIGIRRNCFEPDTLLNVFFLDKNGHSIPVVVTEYRQRMMIRCYIQINDNHPVGFGTFVVIGCLSNYSNGNSIPPNQRLKANIKYQKQIYVNPYEKTPSVLRFRTKPNIIANVDQKRLFKQDIVNKCQYITISNISIQKQHNDFICLNIDTSSITHSVFYEKFLNYKLTNDISHVIAFNQIFSGSTNITETNYLGNFYGSLTSSNNLVVLDKGQVTIKKGILSVGNVSNSNISLLEGQGLNKLIVENWIFDPRKDLKDFYSIYLESDTILNITQLGFSDLSRIKQIQYISKIKRATNISLKTHYFSGSINIRDQGQIYSEQLKFNSNGFEIFGSYKDLEIKRPEAFTNFLLNENEYYKNISITNSNNGINVLSVKNTILTNCNIENAFIGHKLSTQPITFDYLQGQIFSTNLITRMQFDHRGNSFFSGSMKGSGTLYAKNNSLLKIDEHNTRIYNSGSFIKLENSYTFIGQAYNANIQVLQFSGSIYSSSIMDQQYQIFHYNPNITYSKMLLESEKFEFRVSDISKFDISIPKGANTPAIFSLEPNENDNSYIKIKSQTPFTISLQEGNYTLNGHFNLSKGSAQNSEFTGYYQLSDSNQQYYEIQLYQLVNCILPPSYQRIFGTKEVHFFDNDYSKIYIPIAIDLEWRNYDIRSLEKLITSSTDTNSLQIAISYSYKNSLKQPELIKISDTVPLYITINDVDIYSGHFNSLQVLYNNTLDNNAYQLLSNIELIDNTIFPITKSLDLPILNFSGQTTNLLFKPKDALGRYSPEQFYHQEYNLNLQSQIPLYKIQGNKIVYIGGSRKDDSSFVTSINKMTGEVELNAYDIPYLQTTQIISTYNLGKLIDTYFDEWQYDAGILSMPSIETTSQGYLILGPAEYLVYDNPLYNPPLYRFAVTNSIVFDGNSGLHGIADKAVSYIKFSYQQGLYCNDQMDEINFSNVIPILTVYRTGSNFYYIDSFEMSKGIPNKLTERLIKTRKFQIQPGGLLLGESTSTLQQSTKPPYITSTEGYVWYGTQKIKLSFANSETNETSLWYLHGNPSTWSFITTNSYDNLHYNDTNSGLMILDPNKFNVNWIYRFVANNATKTAIVLGTQQYDTMQQAQAQASIPIVPPLLKSHAILIGRAIIKKESANCSIIESAFDTQFAGSSMGSSGVNYVMVIGQDGIQSIVNDPSSAVHIILSLGDITPNSVKTSGSISGSSITTSIITASEIITSELEVEYINGTASSQFENTPVQFRYKFQPTQEYVIGDSHSRTISWSVYPTYETLGEQYYTLSYAEYPDEKTWIQYESGSLDYNVRSITLPACSKSTRLEIVTYNKGYPSYGKYGYIYFRNYIYAGVANNSQNFQEIIDSLEYKQLAKSYISQFQLFANNPDEFLYFACPKWMIESFQPFFIIDGINGGFTKSSNDIINYTNTKNFTQEYVIYNTVNDNLGHTFLQIRNPLYNEKDKI